MCTCVDHSLCAGDQGRAWGDEVKFREGDGQERRDRIDRTVRTGKWERGSHFECLLIVWFVTSPGEVEEQQEVKLTSK